MTLRQDAIVLALVISILFGMFLGSRPLTTPDEGRYAEIPREMVVSHDYLTPQINGIQYFEKPPLFFWVQSASIKLFGVNDWSVRVMNALIALFGCLITYWAGRELYNRRTGLLSAVILATSALYFGLARYITLDMPLSVMLSSALFCFILGEQSELTATRRKYFLLMYVFCALATLTKGLIGIFLPGAVLFIWVLVMNRWRDIPRYYVISGAVLLFAIAAPWHILMQLKHPDFFHFYFMEQHFLRYLTSISGREKPLWYLPVILLGGLLPWCAWLPQAIKAHWPASMRERQNYATEIFLILWALVIFVFFWVSQSQLSPYILPIFPALALILGRYFDGVLSKTPEKSRGFSLGVAAYVVLTLTLAVGGFIFYGGKDPKMLITIALLASSTLATALAFWRASPQIVLTTLIATFTVFFWSLTFSIPPTDTRSIKPLANIIKPLLKDSDIVVSYLDYYHDLPVYLERRILVVHWWGELTYGITHQDATGLWMQDKDFWPLWQKPGRMFMIMSLKDYRSLKLARPQLHMIELSRTKRNLLLVNQPI